ncbi:MAG: delta subunit [Verrucomicrobia bacterium]|nr:MAG: delta subunit [Verrucomicrobiota bacterium]
MALTESTLRVALYEGPGAKSLSSEIRFETLKQLLSTGCSVRRAADPGEVAVWVGDFENEAESQAQTRIPVGQEGLASAIEVSREAHSAAPSGQWKPWFPVIDYDRCTNCMQCLSFCLFGVYGVDSERKLQVQNQDNCKTNCPACSRVCPEAAILFPKYKAGPINGDVVSDADLEREKMKVDISALLGGDVYSLLRERTAKAQSRFSKERDADKALAERQKCLTKLAALSADIPPEVLASLPSPEEISRRAQEAAAKARAALASQN